MLDIIIGKAISEANAATYPWGKVNSYKTFQDQTPQTIL